jgi:hypothetical protein
MKTCGYCGRENEDAAVVCRECGLSEFPKEEKNTPIVHAAEAAPEIPTPDVESDQEAALCPFCLFPNLPDRGWCKQCGTPFNTSVMGPFEGALAEGFMWRSVVRGHPKGWVVVAVWIIFCPWFCIASLSFLGFLVAGLIPPAILMAVSAAIPFMILYQVTKNYVELPEIKLDE